MKRIPSSAFRAAALIAALAPASIAVAQEKPAAPAAPGDAPVAAPAAPASTATATATATPTATPTAASAAAEKAAPAPAKPPGPSITPYGFVLLTGFFNSGPFTNKDNANQVKPPVATDRDGNFVASARGTRVGFRLDNLDAGLLRAKLGGVVEFDFKGGHFSTASSGWNAFVPRLRLAYARAEWKTDAGVFSALAGQDWGVILNVNPNTVSYSCDPVFVQSGNLYRRAPQLKASWDLKTNAFGISVAVAALSPADIDTQLPSGSTGTAVDNGAGNKSRMPDLEGRVGLTANAGPMFSGTVGVGYHLGKRRYFFTNTGNVIVDQDVDAKLLGVDADLSVTPYLQLKGELYDNEGVEDGYSGGFPGVFPSNRSATSTAPASLVPVTSQGWWGQATLKPFPFLWLAGGYGEAKATKSKLAQAAGVRYENDEAHGAIIFIPSKALRLSLEAAQTRSKYMDPLEGSRKATQLSFGAQLFF